MKRFLSVLIALVMVLSVLSMNALAADIKAEDGYSVGDVDGNGTINAIDSLSVKARISGMSGYSCNTDAADVDADGQVSAMDSYYIKGFITGSLDIADYESEHNVYKLLIGGYDISEFCIVVPAEATREDNAHYSAERMQKFVEIATGVELEICYGDENRTAEHAIVYHMVPLDSALGSELGYEGYRYTVGDGDMNIYGTARGNMYATFTIIERMGFVFCNDEFTFIYENRRIDIDDCEEQYIPALSFRMVKEHFGGGGCDIYFYPRKLNGSQLYQQEDSTRTGCLTGPRFINAHSYSYYWRMATGNYTDDDHLYECWLSGEQMQESDYGTTPPWQPCATSDSDYEKLMLGLDRTITMIAKRGQKFTPNISAMSFSICDNQKGYCSCRNCNRKSKNAGEGFSGLYVDLTNRAARDIRTIYPEYPTLKLMTIIYDHTIPKTVRPESNVIIFFCGQGCNNHPINSGGCDANPPLVHKLHNSAVVESLKAWTGFCHDAGAEIWFWYYPVSYLYYMAPSPNTLKIYDDLNFIINECGVDGVYFESGGENYGFEAVKSHMASLYIYTPHMTQEEYTEKLLEFLYIQYGDGYEYVYEYLLCEKMAGTKDECYLNNFSYPEDMYNMDYVAENYETMRKLLTDALELADDEREIEQLEKLLATCDFTGLSAVHESWYAEGVRAEEYMANYDHMCEIIQKYDMRPNTFTQENGEPEQIDFSNYELSPLKQLA